MRDQSGRRPPRQMDEISVRVGGTGAPGEVEFFSTATTTLERPQRWANGRADGLHRHAQRSLAASTHSNTGSAPAQLTELTLTRTRRGKNKIK